LEKLMDPMTWSFRENKSGYLNLGLI
jgi:hypothetical protein